MKTLVIFMLVVSSRNIKVQHTQVTIMGIFFVTSSMYGTEHLHRCTIRRPEAIVFMYKVFEHSSYLLI